MRLLGTTVLLVLSANFLLADEVTFKLTGDNTKVGFVGSKSNGKHEGGFKKVTGTASADTADLTKLKINLDIDMNSTFTDTPKLTQHLKSPDFFGVKNNPSAKFVSTKVEKSGEQYTVTGKLTLAGQTKELSFPAKIEVKDGKLNLTSSFKIDRNDWGISYGKGKINDEVSLSVSVNAGK
jgi:polyisoprenoid-binding protein YceI